MGIATTLTGTSQANAQPASAAGVPVNTSQSEKMLLFDLDDILKCKGIPIPTFLADQFSVQIQISHNGMLGPIDHTLAPYGNAASCYVVLSNVEFHYYYWSISQQTVDAIKQSAALLESDGHAFGMSFKTK